MRLLSRLRSRPHVFLVWALAPLLLSACGAGSLAAPTPPAAHSYKDGESSQIHSGTYERVWDAALAALAQIDMPVVDARRDALGGQIRARRAADEADVTVKVEPVERSATRVKVRVGATGDQAAAEQVQRDIDTTLARIE